MYELGSPVLEDYDSFPNKSNKKDTTWTYIVESGILSNHPSSEARVERTRKQTGFTLWKENCAKIENREGKRKNEDICGVWKTLKRKDKRVDVSISNVGINQF